MDSLINGLNTRLNVVLQSTSDKEFYLNLHQYLHFVITNKTLEKILDASGNEYSKAFGTIWERGREYTEEELDVRSAQVVRLERYNLYAIGIGLFMRIYHPLQDQKEEVLTSSPRPDPVVYLMLYGFDRTLKLKLWDKEYLKSYNWWFEGKRGHYEQELRRFHLGLLEKIENIYHQITYS